MLYLPLVLTDRTKDLFRMSERRPGAIVDGVTASRRVLPPRGDEPAVTVWTYEPAGRRQPSGAVLYIHGGGFVLGDPTSYHDSCSQLAADLGALVISPDYRLAPENPFPAGLEDCYTALLWTHANAEELGIDAARIAVAGDSAGGGLAACLAQLAHDRAEVPIVFQALIYPMLDDRTVLREDHQGTGDFIWNPGANRYGWTAYLGHAPGDRTPLPYAVGARREDLAELPAAWIGVGDTDLFYAEDVEYADRLRLAGVPCELFVLPDMYHGADRLRPDAVTMMAFRDSWTAALRTALSG